MYTKILAIPVNVDNVNQEKNSLTVYDERTTLVATFFNACMSFQTMFCTYSAKDFHAKLF